MFENIIRVLLVLMLTLLCKSLMLFENHTRYNNYDDYPISKPTRFSGNIELNLRNEKKSNSIKFQDWTKSYNERSNIPLSLACEIFEKVYKGVMSET